MFTRTKKKLILYNLKLFGKFKLINLRKKKNKNKMNYIEKLIIIYVLCAISAVGVICESRNSFDELKRRRKDSKKKATKLKIKKTNKKS